MLHSQGLAPLKSIRSHKTKKAFKRFSEVSRQKKRRKLEENSSASSAPEKPVRLTNVDVSNLMVKRGTKTEDELLSLAWVRAKDGEPDLQNFVLHNQITNDKIFGHCTVTPKIMEHDRHD